jgi:cell wall-associated NlpC family hydrolase
MVGGSIIYVAEQARLFPRDAAAITRSARRYFEGTSYLWGGVTPWGADCSGLVQATYALHGVQLPRDAWQQASAGVPADADPLAAREGDLLFFSDRVDRHITHVAIALGARSIVHLALGRGGYGIEHLHGMTREELRDLHARDARLVEEGGDRTVHHPRPGDRPHAARTLNPRATSASAASSARTPCTRRRRACCTRRR